MSIVLLSLRDTDADQLRWNPQILQRTPHVECTPIGPPQLAALGEVLSVRSRDDLLSDMRLLAGESQERPWVISVPDELALGASTVQPEQYAFLSHQWRRSPQLSSGFDGVQLQELLSRLLRFLSSTDGPFALLVQD